MFNAFLYRTKQISSIAEPLKQGTVPHTWIGIRMTEATYGHYMYARGLVGSERKYWRPDVRSRVHPLDYNGGVLVAVVYDDESQQGKVVSTSFEGDEKVIDTITEKYSIRAVVRDNNIGYVVIHEYMGHLKATILDTTTFMYLGTYEVETNFKQPSGFRFIGNSPQGVVFVASDMTNEGTSETVYLCTIAVSDKVELAPKSLYTYKLTRKEDCSNQRCTICQ